MILLKTVVLLASFIAISAEGYKRVCYYSNAAQYRPVPARLMPDKIDPHICTHLIYAFAGVDENSGLNFTEYNDENLVKDFNNLKKKNPYLITLLAVGGYNQGRTTLSTTARDDRSRSHFARTAIDFIQKWGFDGLSLDWQFYSAPRSARRTDRINFVKLLEELSQAIESSNRRLVLSAAVPSDRDDIDCCYDVPGMLQYLDFINLMSYDIHGPWKRNAEHNSPLYHRDDEIEEDRQKNVAWAASHWVSKGVPSDKLIIGIPTYGRSYTLTRRSNNEIGAPTKRAGTMGPYTKEYGFLAYFEVCEDVTRGNYEWEYDQMVPYLVKQDQWIGYDNEDSFKEKLLFIKDNNYGGAMVWSLDLDDFNKQCVDSKQSFALVSLLKDYLGEYTPENTPSDTYSNPYYDDDDDDAYDSYPADQYNDDDDGNDGYYGDNASKDYKRVCYFENWAQYRKEGGGYTVKDIDPSLCTHLIYSFAKLELNNELNFTEWNDKNLYEEFNGLKANNPGLKTLIATGGWNADSEVYSDMVTSDSSRNHFVGTSVDFLRKWDFDGLDLDWEYPAKCGGRPSDKINFITLLKDLESAFAAESSTTGRPKLLLTAAVAARKSNIDPAYNIKEMAKYLDFINLMSYDLHGHWEDNVGHNSPLYARRDEEGTAAQLNTDWAANYWVAKGTPREKLIIGLPLYGRAYELSDRKAFRFGDQINGAGKEGPYTGEPGFLAYFEICKLKDIATRYWDDEHKVPYLVYGDQWIGYDDPESFIYKLDYIKKNNFGGAMVWAIGFDDFKDVCGTGNNPMMKVIRDKLSSNTDNKGDVYPYDQTQRPPQTAWPTQAPTQTARPTQAPQQTARPTQAPPKTVRPTQAPQTTRPTQRPSKQTPGEICRQNRFGFFNHPDNCQKYIQCNHHSPVIFSCPTGTYWDQRIKNCNWKTAVKCENKRWAFSESVPLVRSRCICTGRGCICGCNTM